MLLALHFLLEESVRDLETIKEQKIQNLCLLSIQYKKLVLLDSCLSLSTVTGSRSKINQPFLTHSLVCAWMASCQRATASLLSSAKQYLFQNIVSETHNWKLLVALWPDGPYGRKKQKSDISAARHDSHTAAQMSKLSLCTSQISMTK